MLHWSDGSDFDFSVESKQLLKEADLLSGKGGEEERESAEEEGSRRERSSKGERVR